MVIVVFLMIIVPLLINVNQNMVNIILQTQVLVEVVLVDTNQVNAVVNMAIVVLPTIIVPPLKDVNLSLWYQYDISTPTNPSGKCGKNVGKCFSGQCCS